MTKSRPNTGLPLAALAALLTAAGSICAGATTAGMAVRVTVAAAGFWAVGMVLDRVLAWAVGSDPQPGASDGDASGDAKGQRLDVRLPAVAPGPGKDV